MLLEPDPVKFQITDVSIHSNYSFNMFGFDSKSIDSIKYNIENNGNETYQWEFYPLDFWVILVSPFESFIIPNLFDKLYHDKIKLMSLLYLDINLIKNSYYLKQIW